MTALVNSYLGHKKETGNKSFNLLLLLTIYFFLLRKEEEKEGDFTSSARCPFLASRLLPNRKPARNLLLTPRVTVTPEIKKRYAHIKSSSSKISISTIIRYTSSKYLPGPFDTE